MSYLIYSPKMLNWNFTYICLIMIKYKLKKIKKIKKVF